MEWMRNDLTNIPKGYGPHHHHHHHRPKSLCDPCRAHKYTRTCARLTITLESAYRPANVRHPPP